MTVTCACCGRETEATKLEVLIPSALYTNLMSLAEQTNKDMSELIQNALALYEREHGN